jgi:anthranilate phosphoribosyltransferase
MILDVLQGKRRDGAYTATVLNAGAAIYLSGRVDSLNGGMTSAMESIESRAGFEALERLRTATTG